ncbi:mobilization protein [Dysgonomonas sp. 216]|uniref:conjugal transfer protein MobB n=1 Tax=Dysgonomonas sp. 216 TaxID=2302934 RepID=UPI0013D54969|nr:conjugal transfer protein MobB [Dysgonomonas sp. 216]NDW18757.1 mobilization protein [Dysgonomonas sp. 216]
MVAKISAGKSLFGAISYNQQKVDEGTASVLLSQNIIRPVDGSYNIPLCMRSFEPYLAANNKTLNPVIHISLNPHPDDKLSDEQLKDIAREYMEKLGYGKQPYLIYKHEDIDRMHLHIVSVRVDENGKKIDDSYEKRRSKNITRALEKKYNLMPAEKQKQSESLPVKPVDINAGNVKKQIANTVKALVKDYRFQSVNEFRALLSLYNITVEEVKGEVRGKPYNGLVYSALDKEGEKVGNPFKASLIGKTVGYNALYKRISTAKETTKERGVYNRSRDIIVSALKNNPDRMKFEKELLKNGMSVLFRVNNEGRIYGVTFIDHKEKAVFNGSRLGKEFSANIFHELFNGNNRKQEESNGFDINKGNADVSGYTSQQQEQGSTAESIAGIFSMEQHGDNYEEIAFVNRMKRKKKKRKGRNL